MVCCFYYLFASVQQVKDTELLLNVALLIKKIREEKAISQENVYFDTGIHIGRIELGKQNISLSTLSTLCKYFDITLIDFFVKLNQI